MTIFQCSSIIKSFKVNGHIAFIPIPSPLTIKLSQCVINPLLIHLKYCLVRAFESHLPDCHKIVRQFYCQQ